MPSVFIKTYGCQMNERDSEQVARQLLDRGYELAPSENDADVILLNTCSVRDLAEQKALRKMENLQVLKRQKPHLILGMLGCVAQNRGQELLDRLPDLDLVVGTQQCHRVADYVDARRRLANGKRAAHIEAEADSQNAIKDHLFSPPTAFVSIMQGCNMRCSFCIVPATRGRQRSRPMRDILQEARRLVSDGVKEITLLGQIVNLYGWGEFPFEKNRSPFTRLLYELENIEGLERIRFASPHPLGVKADLIQAFRDLKKLCEHLHLPAQSGSDAILKKMKRGYTADRYRTIIGALRAACPSIAFTTDIIVGFPGETDANFQQTRALIEDIGFDNAFIFKYSERRDTPASMMPHQIPQSAKEARNQELLAVIDRIAQQKSESLKGKTVEVLVEGPSKTNPARLSGRTRANKIVIFDGDPQHRGQLAPIRITDATPFTLYGETAN